MPTPREDIKHAILRWEGPVPKGPYSDGYMQWLDWDPGNAVTMPDGRTVIVGTNYGVTPATLAAHRGVKPWEITREIMSSLQVDEAADIGLMRFYKGTGLDLLPWGPTTSSLVDAGWASGPGQAVLFAQRLAGVIADGVVGPLTIDAYSRWIARVGWEKATQELHAMRLAFFEMLGRQNPAAFGPPQRAWRERALGFKPDSYPDGVKWWARWAADMPPLPVPAAVSPKPAPPEAQAPIAAAPAPASKSRTLKAAATAAAGGAATMADKATDGGVTDIITTTTTKVLGLAGVGGAVMWIAVGITIAGAGYAIWRVVRDRRVVT